MHQESFARLSRWRASQDSQGARQRSRLRPVGQRAEHGIEHQVEFLPDVFRQKAKHKVAVLLKELVLASIPSVRDRVCEVLSTIQFDRDARIGAE